MVSLTALWLPVLLSAVLVFIASAIIHMVLTYHRSDFKKLPDEDRVRAALREIGIPPGDYYFPHHTTPKEMGSPEMLAKYEEGPVGLMTVAPNAPPPMGKLLAIWFLFCVLVSVFAAYVAGLCLGAAAEYMTVFRITSTVAFLGYGASDLVSSIWKAQAWSTTFKNLFDGLVYALLTAGVFGWLWP